MLKLVGFKNGEGQMTTGSSNANMLSMMIARNKFLKNVKNKGLYQNNRLIAFVNSQSHYSLDQAANILGIGTDNLIKIPVLENGDMDIIVLEIKIQETIKDGNIPFCVVATAGTTVRGAFDNIENILLLKEKYGFWFHVDGAWGGPVFFNDKLRKKFLTGIEKVDSFTFDFHKIPGISLMCNMFLINNNNDTSYLGKTFTTGNTDYIFHNDSLESNPEDLGEHSICCGKRVDSLKLFLSWKYYGKEGISEKIQNYYDMCKYAETVINTISELEIITPRVSFNLCFRYEFPENMDINSLNKQIRDTLNTEGNFMVGGAYIDKKYVIRLLFANENTKQENIKLFFDNVVEIGKKLLKKTYA